MSNDVELLRKAETVWGPFKVTNEQEDAFVNGKVFSYEDYRTYATAEVANFIFDPTAYAGTNLVVLPPAFSATAGPVTVDFYANVIETGDGTSLGVSNRRGTSTNVATATLKLNPVTITNDGTRFTGRLVPANATNPVNVSGGQASSNLPFELNTSYKYLIRVTNTNGDDTIIQTDFSWIEG